jgi:hypothetical protein
LQPLISSIKEIGEYWKTCQGIAPCAQNCGKYCKKFLILDHEIRYAPEDEQTLRERLHRE